MYYDPVLTTSSTYNMYFIQVDVYGGDNQSVHTEMMCFMHNRLDEIC